MPDGESNVRYTPPGRKGTHSIDAHRAGRDFKGPVVGLSQRAKPTIARATELNVCIDVVALKWPWGVAARFPVFAACNARRRCVSHRSHSTPAGNITGPLY